MISNPAVALEAAVFDLFGSEEVDPMDVTTDSPSSTEEESTDSKEAAPVASNFKPPELEAPDQLYKHPEFKAM